MYIRIPVFPFLISKYKQCNWIYNSRAESYNMSLKGSHHVSFYDQRTILQETKLEPSFVSSTRIYTYILNPQQKNKENFYHI